MYVPSQFAAGQGAINELLANPGAANLVTSTERGLPATLLPSVYDPEAGDHGALLGHLARNNDQWQLPALGESLVIIQRPMRTSPRRGVRPRPSKAVQGRTRPGGSLVELHHSERLWPAGHP